MNTERRQRIINEVEAAGWIENGMTVAIGQPTPMALVRQIIRRGLKDLTIVDAGFSLDLLIAAGCVRKVVSYYAGGGFGNPVGPSFRRAAERGEIEVWECEEGILCAGLQAAAQALPFLPWRGGVGTTWEARIKLNCLTAGAWPAYWLGNEDQGEIDVVEWYGNGSWPSATTVHARANGGEWKTHNMAVDSGWHTWRCQWDDAGIRFWKDYVDGAQPYFDVPASSLPDWPFNRPGYTVFPVFNLAVAGSGGAAPSLGTRRRSAGASVAAPSAGAT